MPERRECEAEPAFVNDFTGSKRAQHAAIEQIVFGPLAGLSDGRRFAPGSFVIEQPFEHADGGMERRSTAFGGFPVPAAIFELLLEELIGQCVIRFFEIRADAEDSAVDAGLRLAVKERPVAELLKHEALVDALDHFARLLADGVETEVLQDGESVAMRDRSAAIALGAAPVRSFMTCQRMAGSESRSHFRCAGRGA